jgi:type IV pilus assembly protein PilY1
MKKIITQCVSALMLLMAAVFALPAQAQYTSDIDIYSASSSGEQPNILFILDNTANWSSAFQNEVGALIKVFAALPADRFRVGLMMFTETGGEDAGNAGGYMRAAIRTLDADYKSRLGSMLSSLDVNNDKSNGGKAGITMAEAYYYLAGKAPYSGNNKAKTDYTGNTFGTVASKGVYDLPGNALTAKSASPYQAPGINSCERTYVIYISNGAVQDNNSDTSTASQLLTAAYADAGLVRPANDVVIAGETGSAYNQADEWARFMKNSLLNISTFTVDVDPVKNGQGPGWSALLKSMAAASGGEYFAVNSQVGGGQEIVNALISIFNQIQAADSIFASAGLPASNNARGSFQNQVFMGLFRPDEEGQPRWRGNLKQYKFSYNPTTDSLFLSDQNGNPALTGASGFFSPSATSLWTASSTFWINQPLGTPPSASDAPDGEVVEKGGVAQRIRTQYATTQSTRNIYTCVGCATNTNLATNTAAQFKTTTTAISASLLGVTNAERTALIEWVRGVDNRGDEAGPAGTTTIRPSVHGDVLHSRPAVINYGGSTGVVVFYGANDGLLRAVNGNTTGTGAGNELWGFLPEEHFPRLKRIAFNTPEVRLSNTLIAEASSASSPTPRDYFVDGPISTYQKLNAGGGTEKAIIYVGMRRGGRFVYALDVTNPTEPKFLWKKTSASLSGLGQTWSEPKLAKLRGHANPVLVMGAGYDAAAEDLPTPGTTTMGNSVLVLDAFTGDFLKRFDTDRSVPADVALVDSDSDGYVDRAYAVDVGGNIYRIDFEKDGAVSSSAWGIFKLASLAGGATRKFLYAPDVIVTKQFTAVMAGSGDREKPLAKTSADAFFTIFDRWTAKGTVLGEPPVSFSQLSAIGSEGDMTKGCYLAMNTGGEKIVNALTTVGGMTYFGTNQPTSSSTNMCKPNLGVAKVYAVPLFCQAPSSQTLVSGGLPPSPVAGTVEVSYTVNQDGTEVTLQKRVPFIIGGINPKASPIEVTKVNPNISPRRKRSYWFLENAR